MMSVLIRWCLVLCLAAAPLARAGEVFLETFAMILHPVLLRRAKEASRPLRG